MIRLPQFVLLALLAACGGASGADSGAPFDGAIPDAGTLDAATADAGSFDAGPFDASSFDAGPFDAGPFDAGPARDAGYSSDAAVGAPCDLNRQCAAAQRCDCNPSLVCTCQLGVRGTGRVGVDECVDGNDCASALCVEGADRYWCSEECVSDADCAGALPRCVTVAGFVSLCARNPPDGG